MGKRLWDLAKSRFEIATILLGHRYIVFFLFYAIFYLFPREFAILAAMLSRLATACRRC